MEKSMFSLRKVDFFWINRDQKSFEWFVNLLSQLEMEQAVQGGEMDRLDRTGGTGRQDKTTGQDNRTRR